MLPDIVLTTSTHERLSLLVSLLRDGNDNDLLEFVDQELARANLVRDDELGSTVAALGSRIRYRDNITGSYRTATLTYPGHEHSLSDGLSVLTPEGACLIGLSEGQSMQYWTLDTVVCDITLISVLQS